MEYVRCSWEEIDRLTNIIYNQIGESGFEPQVIVGVGSGGFITLRLLLDRFRGSGNGRPYLPAVASLYDRTGVPGELDVCYMDGVVDIDGKNVLITDDVADTGRTLRSVNNYYRPQATDVRTATLHLKPESVIIPEYYAMITSSWIIYPWEIQETIRDLCYDEVGTVIRLKKPSKAREELDAAQITRKELERFGNNLGPKDQLKHLIDQLLKA
jgi:hypothetical protein